MLSLTQLWEPIPESWKQSIYHRFLFPPSQKWNHLYESASLKYAPGIEMQLVPTDRMHRSIAFLGYYERLQSKLTLNLAQEVGGLLVDVGANAGYYSLLWTAQAPENRAIAIEPSPLVLPLLKENVTRNGLEEQITVLDVAAGDRNCEVQFQLGSSKETGWGGVAPELCNEETLAVQQQRIDEIVDEKVDLLKIDVEGTDLYVLKGSRNLLDSNQVRHICFEHNVSRARKHDIGENEPTQFLQQVGYKVTRRHGDYWASPQRKDANYL
jgi:FkbM family methyltransferase